MLTCLVHGFGDQLPETMWKLWYNQHVVLFIIHVKKQIHFQTTSNISIKMIVLLVEIVWYSPSHEVTTQCNIEGIHPSNTHTV